MDAPLYRKVSNAVLRKISRALSFNDEGGISSMNDTLLLNVFFYLPTSDLLCVSKVCKRWNQLASHPMLWKSVDLRRYSKPLHDKFQLQYVAKSYLAYKVITLDMSGFTVPQTILNTLTTSCPDLKKLVFKSVTFCKDDDDNQMLFPANLEYLDVRYSHGPIAVYQAMARQFSNLQWLGMCDALLLALSNEQSVPNAFASLQKLEKLDMTHCQLVKDTFLFKFCPCQNLRLLSLRKCLNISGESLPVLIARLNGLETLILDGTSVHDEYLKLVEWKNTNIKYLELGWCTFITTDGLQAFLPKIAQIPTLEYLGLCNVGQGQALTDNVLKEFAQQLQQGTCPKLHSLNLSFSKQITDEGLATFENMHYIDTLDVTKCAQITEDDDDECIFFGAPENKESTGICEVISEEKGSIPYMADSPVQASPRRNSSRNSVSSQGEVFRTRTSSRTSLSSMNDIYRSRNASVSSMGDDGMPRMRRRSSRGSFSTIQFALSNYTLETPL